MYGFIEDYNPPPQKKQRNKKTTKKKQTQKAMKAKEAKDENNIIRQLCF